MAVTIKSNLTQLEHTISDDAWKKMQGNGESRRYTVVKKGVSDTKETSPVVTDYDKLKADAETAETAGELQKAIDLYKQLNAINSTKKTTDKIAGLEKKLAESNNN